MGTWNSRGLRGSTLEEFLNRTNEKYLEQGLSLIQKIPTPITPVQIDKEHRHITLAYFDKQSTVDYIGVAFLALQLLVVGIYVGRYEWKIFDVVNNIGIHSYWVLCIHSIEQKCIPWKNFICMTEGWANVGFALTLAMKAIIIMVFCKLLNRLQRWRYRKQKKVYAQKKLRSEND